ncbi:MAG: hypothetical protein ACKVZ6_04570 [Kineosporiaceae bacterium]
MDGDGMSPSVWYPLVYGRTRRADLWWRALPEQPDQTWLRGVVGFAVQGGRDLDRPRLVLAQDGRHRLVAVVCRAIALSDMNSDGQRPLYCCVGWVGDLSRGDHVLGPNVDALLRSYQPWAAPVYEEWMRGDWDRHPSQLGAPQRPPPVPVPWSPDDEQPLEPSRWNFDPTSAYVWPPEQQSVPWDLVRSDSRPAMAVVGLRSVRDLDLPPGVLLSSADVGIPTQVPVRSPEVERPSTLLSPPPTTMPARRGPAPSNPWGLVQQQAAQPKPPPLERPPNPHVTTSRVTETVGRLRGTLCRWLAPEPNQNDPRPEPPLGGEQQSQHVVTPDPQRVTAAAHGAPSGVGSDSEVGGLNRNQGTARPDATPGERAHTVKEETPDGIEKNQPEGDTQEDPPAT